VDNSIRNPLIYNFELKSRIACSWKEKEQLADLLLRILAVAAYTRKNGLRLNSIQFSRFPAVFEQVLSCADIDTKEELRQQIEQSILDRNLKGFPFLQCLITMEGAFLILEGFKAETIFESLASFFGAQYYTALKKKIKRHIRP